MGTSQQISLKKALGVATVRRIKRLHKVHCELAELQTAVVTPEELVLLEDHGFIVDFETGQAVDTLHISHLSDGIGGEAMRQ